MAWSPSNPIYRMDDKFYVKGPRTGVDGQGTWAGIPHEYNTRAVEKPIVVTLKKKKKQATKK